MRGRREEERKREVVEPVMATDGTGTAPNYLTILFHIMSAIGKRGFQAALDLGYGEYLLTKLAPSYRAKFGTEPTLGRNRAGDTARAQARRATPTLGVCQWPDCTAPATERHHVDGWTVSADTTGLCTAHHDAFDRAYRATRKVWRPRTADPVTPRAVALSIGIGLDDAIPF